MAKTVKAILAGMNGVRGADHQQMWITQESSRKGPVLNTVIILEGPNTDEDLETGSTRTLIKHGKHWKLKNERPRPTGNPVIEGQTPD